MFFFSSPGVTMPRLWSSARLLPGTAARTVARKVGLDMLVFALPYYTAFYTSLNLLAGRPVSSSIAELRSQANTCHMLHKMHSQPK